MSFAKTLGRVLAAGLEVAAENARRNDAFMAEQMEADRWQRRKEEVFAMVDRGLAKPSPYKNSYMATYTADRIRQDAIMYCSRRSEAMMRSTEQAASSFELRGY